MMKNIKFSVWRSLTFMALSLWCVAAAWAQTGVRRVYPAPKMTPQVRYIQSQSKTFAVTAGAEVALPVAVDNSLNMFFPPILDQKGGSCAQASGIGYMFTYEMNRYLGRDAKASAGNRFAYLFSWNMINDGIDQGGFVDEGLFLARRYGMMTEADYGMASTYSFKWASGYDKYYRAMQYRTKEIIRIPDSVPLIKRYLYDAGDGSKTGGILTFSTRAQGWKFIDDYSGPSATGYHCLLTRLATDGAHAMTIAGYDDLVTYTDAAGQVHRGAFIVVNSWGTYSHDRGRFYLPYDFFRRNHSEIELGHTLIGVRVMTHRPEVVYKVNVSYSKRSNLSFGMAYTADRTLARPADFAYCYAFKVMGGAYPMQGQWSAQNIEIAMEYPQAVAADADIRKFFFNVMCVSGGKEVGKGTLDALQVYDYRYGDEPRVYVCRTPLPAAIGLGQNIYQIPLAPLYVVSASPYRWSDAGGNPTPQTYLIRTARGRHGKFRVETCDAATGKLTLKYTILNQ